MHVGVARTVDLVHGLEDRGRLLGRGSAVQVHQWLEVYVFGQDRKVLAYALDVEGEGRVAAGQAMRDELHEGGHVSSPRDGRPANGRRRTSSTEEQTYELQSLMSH